MNTTERQDFVKKLKAAAQLNEDDDALFAEIIREAGADLTDMELSVLLTVSRPTVNRWKNGRTTPHRLIKPRIYQMLLDRMLKFKPAGTRSTRPQAAEEVAAE